MTEKRTRQLDPDVGVNEINACRTMQLATSHDGQPWNSTVYFVVYDGNFYWLSFPERRHSLELGKDPRAAIALVLQPEQPVVGIQAEGVAGVVQDMAEAQAVTDLYVRKYGQGKQFMTLLRAGSNKHFLYRFTPQRIMLFDERDDRTSSAEEIVIT